MAIYRRIADIEPGDAASRRGLAVSLGLLAERQAADGERRAVIGATFRESLTLAKSAVAADPVNEKAKEELADVQHTGWRLGL